MTTVADTQKTPVQVSPEVKAIHRRMLRRHRLTRGFDLSGRYLNFALGAHSHPFHYLDGVDHAGRGKGLS